MRAVRAGGADFYAAHDYVNVGAIALVGFGADTCVFRAKPATITDRITTQRRFAPLGGRFPLEWLAGLPGIRTRIRRACSESNR